MPGSEILLARSAADVCAALDLSDAELHRIAAAARERTLAEHTADQRAAELESLLQGAMRGLPAAAARPANAAQAGVA